MAAEPGLPSGDDGTPGTDGTHHLMRIYVINVLNLVINIGVYPVLLQVMCVLMVCFNVLELLLDETALPRGMEVKKLAGRLNKHVLPGA